MASIKKWIQDEGEMIPLIKRKQDLFFENGMDFFDRTFPLISIIVIAISISFSCGLIAIGFCYLIFGITRFFLTEKPVVIPRLGNFFYHSSSDWWFTRWYLSVFFFKRSKM